MREAEKGVAGEMGEVFLVETLEEEVLVLLNFPVVAVGEEARAAREEDVADEEEMVDAEV
jgi:hypothetical protein